MNILRRSAVDRAWASYDIAAAILENLAPGPPLQPPSIYRYDEWAWEDQRRRNRHALAEMACVSRALSGLALDVLWRYIDNIFCLMNVIPSWYSCESMADFREQIVSSCTIVGRPDAPG